MTSRSYILSLLLLLFAPITMLQAEIHHWIDSDGKSHFSDKKPTDESSKKFIKPSIQRLNFNRLTLKKIKFPKSRKTKIQTVDKKSACEKIKASIAKLEKTLTTRQNASQFDKQNEQLVKLRWQKIKLC